MKILERSIRDAYTIAGARPIHAWGIAHPKAGMPMAPERLFSHAQVFRVRSINHIFCSWPPSVNMGPSPTRRQAIAKGKRDMELEARWRARMGAFG